MTVDITDGCAAINDVGAIFLWVDVLAGDQHVGGEFADDLFQNIFKSHQANYIAVLVDHDRDAAFLFLKVEQLRMQRGAFRNEVGGLAGADQGFLGQLAAT